MVTVRYVGLVLGALTRALHIASSLLWLAELHAPSRNSSGVTSRRVAHSQAATLRRLINTKREMQPSQHKPVLLHQGRARHAHMNIASITQHVKSQATTAHRHHVHTYPIHSVLDRSPSCMHICYICTDRHTAEHKHCQGIKCVS